MEFNDFHFSHPLWLLSGLAVPAVWILAYFYQGPERIAKKLETFIDSHLLPHLLVHQSGVTHSYRKPLAAWSAIWLLLTLALAGPRWDYDEIETYSKDQSLVILLDLSRSMDAADVKPSRLIRAKQKIEDLTRLSQGVHIGIIAFAADPHMITPLTDDAKTIRHLLPSLNTDLVYVQGSRLSPALRMAETLLDAEPGSNKAILLISDGGFEDASAISEAKKLSDKGIAIYAMGMGTSEGAPINDKEGNFIKKDGELLLSRLEETKLQEIGKAGKGRYWKSEYSNQGEASLVDDLKSRADAQTNLEKTTRLWEERFYLFIFPTLPILLWWFRKGALSACVILLLLPNLGLDAAGVADYFKNKGQLAAQALESGDYDSAANLFEDPYRKGVASYKSGNYSEAEKLFRQSAREEVAEQAAYNLGNALALQEKYKEAVAAYEKALQKWPDNQKAKDNLEIVKKLLEENEQQQENPEQNENEPDEQPQESGNDQEDSQKGEDQDSQESSENEQNNEPDTEEPSKPEQSEQKDAQEKETPAARSQEDLDADQWLDRISQDPQQFMKNKFIIESKKNGTQEGIDPW